MNEVVWDKLTEGSYGSPAEIDQLKRDIEVMARQKHATYVVLFEREDISVYGTPRRHYMMVGPECTVKDISDIKDRDFIGATPSEREYVQWYARVPWA